MTPENATEHMIESFNRGIFPEPQDFSDKQIEAIAAQPGINANGAFADAPLEQALIHRYRLEDGYGEHTWPGFAEFLREAKSEHFGRVPSFVKEKALDRLNECIAECLSLGISHEQIADQIPGAQPA